MLLEKLSQHLGSFFKSSKMLQQTRGFESFLIYLASYQKIISVSAKSVETDYNLFVNFVPLAN